MLSHQSFSVFLYFAIVYCGFFFVCKQILYSNLFSMYVPYTISKNKKKEEVQKVETKQKVKTSQKRGSVSKMQVKFHILLLG